MNFRGNKWQWLALAAVLGLAVFFLTFGRELLANGLGQLRAWGPMPFFAVFALCISFGAPPTPFLLAAGAAFGPWTNLLGFSLSYAISLGIAFTWARPLFKSRLEAFLAKKSPVLEGALRENGAMAILLVRLTPGFPYVLQNCLLAAVSRSIKPFIFISLPPLVGYAMLYASLGRSLAARHFGLLGFLVAALAGVAVMIRFFLRRRSQTRASDSQPPQSCS
jgi:uncharacterized membrane protein YdjX (TVP38/TMEM64 family)